MHPERCAGSAPNTRADGLNLPTPHLPPTPPSGACSPAILCAHYYWSVHGQSPSPSFYGFSPKTAKSAPGHTANTLEWDVSFMGWVPERGPRRRAPEQVPSRFPCERKRGRKLAAAPPPAPALRRRPPHSSGRPAQLRGPQTPASQCALSRNEGNFPTCLPPHPHPAPVHMAARRSERAGEARRAGPQLQGVSLQLRGVFAKRKHVGPGLGQLQRLCPSSRPPGCRAVALPTPRARGHHTPVSGQPSGRTRLARVSCV